MLGRLRIAWVAAIVCIALAAIACDAKGDEKVTGNASPGASGPISASPNPCKRSGAPVCTAVITWNAGGVNGEITVQDSSGPEVVFARGPQGNVPAPWIDAAPHEYTFRLYDMSKTPQQLLGSVVVKGE